MKIIDFEKKGQSVRFYLGKDSCDNYYGDDWDDIPYEHNSGKVYDEFIEDTIDIVFDFDDIILEPCEDWHNKGNSLYCKNDMKSGKVPCIVVLPKDEINNEFDSYDLENDFSRVLAHNKCKKFYFNESVESFLRFI